MKTKTAILLNLVLIVLVLYSWITMASGNDTGTMLTDVRLRSLRYLRWIRIFWLRHPRSLLFISCSSARGQCRYGLLL